MRKTKVNASFMLESMLPLLYHLNRINVFHTTGIHICKRVHVEYAMHILKYYGCLNLKGPRRQTHKTFFTPICPLIGWPQYVWTLLFLIIMSAININLKLHGG